MVDSASGPPQSPSLQASKILKKRKREGHAESKAPIRKKKSGKIQRDDDADLDLENGINTAVGRFDSHLLADHVAQRTKRFQPDLSLVELEDRHIPGLCAQRSWSHIQMAREADEKHRDSLCGYQRMGIPSKPRKFARIPLQVWVKIKADSSSNESLEESWKSTYAAHHSCRSTRRKRYEVWRFSQISASC